jgi:transcriptional regulator with XRE-family HTH domain
MNAKLFRASLRLTEQELADACGVDRQTVARWESDDAEFPVKFLRLIQLFCASPESRPEVTPELLAGAMVLLFNKMERILASQKAIYDLLTER